MIVDDLSDDVSDDVKKLEFRRAVRDLDDFLLFREERQSPILESFTPISERPYIFDVICNVVITNKKVRELPRPILSKSEEVCQDKRMHQIMIAPSYLHTKHHSEVRTAHKSIYYLSS
jgi:hypothetical protein